MALLSQAQLIDYDTAERRRHPAIYREVPSSAQIDPVETNEIFKQQLLSSSHQSRYFELEQAFIELRDQMARLRLVREIGIVTVRHDLMRPPSMRPSPPFGHLET